MIILIFLIQCQHHHEIPTHVIGGQLKPHAPPPPSIIACRDMARFALAFWKDQSVSVTVLQIIALVSLIVALVFCASTIGVFEKQLNELKDKSGYKDACFLFATSYNDNSPDGDHSYCEYIIYGQGLIFISIIHCC